jgi:serine/threonine protein phosphatase PrpC
VDEEAITAILREKTTSQDACAQLVQRALDNGGRDNVTVIVAAYSIPDDPPAPATDARDGATPPE